MVRPCPTHRRTRAARVAAAAWFALFNLAIQGLHTCRLAEALFGEECAECSMPGTAGGHRAGASIASASHVAACRAVALQCPACHYLLGCPEAPGPPVSRVPLEGVRGERFEAPSAACFPAAQYSPSCPRAPPVA